MKCADCIEFDPIKRKVKLLNNFTKVAELDNIDRILIINSVVSHVDISYDRVEVLLKGPVKWKVTNKTLRIGSSKWLLTLKHST